MPPLSQDNRPLRVTIGDVPPDGVVLTGFAGTEAVSRLYSFSLTLAAPVDAPIDFAEVLGKPAVVMLDQGVVGADTRFVHGVVSRFAQGARDTRYVWYRAEVVPALWLLTRFTRSRVFQQKTVREILTEVIGDLHAVRFDLDETYPPRNYCVQYRESDFAFVSRLMEEEGLAYYFTHAEGDQELVITDKADGYDPVPGEAALTFQDENNAVPSEGRVTRWDKAQEVRAGKYAVTEHHFEMPPQDFAAQQSSPDAVTAGAVAHALVPAVAAGMVSVDHPAGFAHLRDGIAPGGGDRASDLDPLFQENKRAAGVALGQQMAGVIEVEGDGTYVRMTAGHQFTLAEHFDAVGDYVLTSVRHAATCGAPDSAGDGDYQYANRFVCFPHGTAYRPARVTPWPFIRGTQTAVVVGDDPEIDPDKYGRVKVRFFWDPEPEKGLDTSCWVRVAQFWAGRAWGAQFIPRVGDEVVVTFEDGDPDRPLIIGSVYNADNMPVYKLPDNKTQSGIKTFSSPDGEAKNFNEIRFEDKKGHELVHIQAERDMSTTVERHETVLVGVNSGTTIGNNSTVTIGTDSKADPHAAGKSTTTIFGDTATTISKGDHTFDVQTGKSTAHVMGPVAESFEDTMTTQVKNAITMKSQAGVVKLQADGNDFFIAAKNAVDVKSDTAKVNVAAATEIKLTVGASSLLMKADGTIELKGVMVTVNGTKVDVTAAALCTVKGAMVKINC
ncbi:MAG: type VI secretion system tip protein VgrG [Gemmataceae bacterium]|nr:type VI secretion system tip protein VgrG [Gemmataceae bacterium]